MSKRILQLGLLLALTVLSAFPSAQAAELTPYEGDFQYGTTKSGVGSTMDQACANAIQNLKNYCGIMAAPTTNPGGCTPIYNLEGEFVGRVCRCEATTISCLNG